MRCSKIRSDCMRSQLHAFSQATRGTWKQAERILLQAKQMKRELERLEAERDRAREEARRYEPEHVQVTFAAD